MVNINGVIFWIQSYIPDGVLYYVDTLPYGWNISVIDPSSLSKEIFYIVKDNGKVHNVPQTCDMATLRNIEDEPDFMNWQIVNHILDVVDVVPPF